MSDLSQPIYLANLVHRFASFSFNEIEKLLDENSGEDSQKRSLMRNLNEIYTLGTKIHMAIMFDTKYRHSKELFMYLHNSSFYEQYLDRFAQILFQHRAYLQENLASMYDVRGAIDLILDNCRSRLPLSIFPKPPLYVENPSYYFKLIRSILKSKLLTTRVPAIYQVKFSRGRVILTAPNQYKLFLSIKTKDGPFVATKLNFIIPEFYTHKGFVTDILMKGVDASQKYIIHTASVAKILDKVNELMQKHEDSLFEIDSFLQRTILLFDYQRICVEVFRLCRSFVLQYNTYGIRFKFFSAEYNNRIRIFFWKSFFDLQPTPTGITIYFEGSTSIGDASGMRFTDILGLCERRLALIKLHTLQSNIEGTLHDEGKVPYLHVALYNVIVENINGLYHVVDHPEYDYLLLNSSTYEEFLKIVSKKHNEEIALNHVKGDSINS